MKWLLAVFTNRLTKCTNSTDRIRRLAMELVALRDTLCEPLRASRRERSDWRCGSALLMENIQCCQAHFILEHVSFILEPGSPDVPRPSLFRSASAPLFALIYESVGESTPYRSEVCTHVSAGFATGLGLALYDDCYRGLMKAVITQPGGFSPTQPSLGGCPAGGLPPDSLVCVSADILTIHHPCAKMLV